MMIGTPPSLSSENEGLDQAMAIGVSSVPVEQFTDYECCVCRTSKSDSESPIGLIGTSCLSLRKYSLNLKQNKTNVSHRISF